MNTIKSKLIENFKSRTSSPFLFIGSGFSKRYLGLDDWKSLLSRFCSTKPFTYYLSIGDGSIPVAARLIAKDFNDIWWTDDKYIESRKINTEKVKNDTSTLRIEIANYLSTLDQDVVNKEYEKEINLLKQINVDGIITTNWDNFLETLFPSYSVYTGQAELLFSDTLNICEIYKIHGSRHIPESLILTDKDYDLFNEKNPYLASKLITIFVEHPVVFIGYSLSDVNIRSLLSSIATCIGSENINKLRDNLIFINRIESEHDEEGITDTLISMDNVQIPVKQVKTNDFSCVYEAMIETKRKIPVKMLRHLKEQFYNLVRDNTSDNEKKLCVVDFDQIEDFSKVEFVVGLGVAEQKRREDSLSTIGYQRMTLIDIINNLLLDDKEFDCNMMLTSTLPTMISGSAMHVPVWKYLNKEGINTKEKYKKSKYNKKLDKLALKDLNDFKVKNHTSKYENEYCHYTLSDLISTLPPGNAAMYILHMKKEDIDLSILKNFLITNQSFIKAGKYTNYFRRLSCYYDHIKYCKQ